MSREHIPKSEYGHGPWQDEPDEKRWTDAPTGYPCVALRNPITGGWCGYVGVPESHPAYGLSYDGTPSAEFEARMKRFSEDTRRWAAAGYPPLEKWWEMNREENEKYSREHEPMPGIGEAIVALVVHGGVSYAKLSAERGSPYWWFGFDCGHAGDFAPAIEAVMRLHMPKAQWERHNQTLGLGAPTGWGTTIEYRTLAYVEHECEALAAQLKAIADRAPPVVLALPREQKP